MTRPQGTEVLGRCRSRVRICFGIVSLPAVHGLTGSPGQTDLPGEFTQHGFSYYTRYTR